MIIPRSLFAIATLWALGAGAAFGAILEDVVEQAYEIPPTATVSIRNTEGRIFVYGGEEPQIKISAARRALTKERLEAIKISVEIKGEVVAVETISPPVPRGSLFADRSGTVDYTIVVPQSCTLANVELANGEILIQNLRGEGVEARLGRGLLHLRDCFSGVRATLGQGRLDAFYSWWDTRSFSLSAEVSDGELRLALPVNAALQLDAASVHGEIKNRFREPGPDEVGRWRTEIGGGSAIHFKLRTIAGNIWIERAY